MLYIKKKIPSVSTQLSLAEVRNTPEWRAIPDTDVDALRTAFNSVKKAPIQDDLLLEQRGLCAYCMRRIHKNDDKPDGMRIEHYVPLSSSKEKSLDYSNYLGVCNGGSAFELSETGTSGISGRQKLTRILCCDAKKDDDELAAINPWNENIMSHIAYTRDGIIYFNGQSYGKQFCDNAERDIFDALGLNGKYVGSGRKAKCIQDTASRIVQGRRDAYSAAVRILSNMKPLTSHRLDHTINHLLSMNEPDEFVGVIIFKLAQTRDRLRKEGK